MLHGQLRQRYFVFGVIFLCFSYLGLEFFLNAYSMLSVDEFWFAQRTYLYKHHLPYRDFSPYKTVIGYYLLLLPMLVTHSLFGMLVFIKNTIAILNAVILVSTSIWLTRFFSSRAILASLLLGLTSDVVLSYSTNIRVDLFAYWFCFFSLLCLLEKRFFLAGILIGLGFGTSQKALWYLLASNGALILSWLMTTRGIKDLRSIIKFNLAALFTIGLYIALWSSIASWHIVMQNIFSDAAAMYQLGWYNKTRFLFWMLTLTYNPFLFLLWPLTWVSVFVTHDQDTSYQLRLFITSYAAIIFWCLIPYQQVFPYYMQVTIPVFLVLYAAFFSWMFAIYLPRNRINLLIPKPYVIALLASYSIALICVIIFMELPLAYLLLLTIPSLLGLYFFNPYKATTHFLASSFRIIMIICFFIGLLYPLVLFITKLGSTNNAYQKANVEVLNTLLEDGSDYIAGMDFIYNKEQPIAGMKHLMGPAIDYLFSPSDKLRKVMLSSLEQDPEVTSASVINAIKQSSVKYYVNNYRLRAIPKNIQQYLLDQFSHYWGSIYVYAPRISSGRISISIKFDGRYLVDASPLKYIILNDHIYQTHSMIYLKKGDYLSDAQAPYRLRLIPLISSSRLQENYQNDEWERIAL